MPLTCPFRVAATERVVHMILGVTTGAWAGFVFFTGFTDWAARPTALVPTAYGLVSWVLTAYALGAGLSAARDALASERLAHQAKFLPPSVTAPRRRPAMAGR